jgi:hypothetical protein
LLGAGHLYKGVGDVGGHFALQNGLIFWLQIIVIGTPLRNRPSDVFHWHTFRTPVQTGHSRCMKAPKLISMTKETAAVRHIHMCHCGRNLLQGGSDTFCPALPGRWVLQAKSVFSPAGLSHCTRALVDGAPGVRPPGVSGTA